MQGSDRFSIDSLIDNRNRGSLSSDGEDAQDISGPEDESAPETRNAVTSFTVKDILDPHKFNAPRRRPSESDSDSESSNRGESRNSLSWHPWMAATRFKRSQNSSGKRSIAMKRSILLKNTTPCFILFILNKIIHLRLEHIFIFTAEVLIYFSRRVTRLKAIKRKCWSFKLWPASFHLFFLLTTGFTLTTI